MQNAKTLRSGDDCDVFEEAKQTYSIPDIWRAFNLPGTPGKSCKSPFRDDRQASFSVYGENRKWKDHGTGEGGDVIEFIKYSMDGDYSDVREWLLERLGIDRPDGRMSAKTSRRTPKPQPPRKQIELPGELITGTEDTWAAFAKRRDYSQAGVELMIENGILRFTKIKDRKCFIVLDDELRAAEIRGIDGLPFGKSKAYPLTGVDKSWLPGSALLRSAPDDGCVLVCEGATDLLTAFDLYSIFCRRELGSKPWFPVAVLGANCKSLSPDCAELIRGRRVRLAADADQAGRNMLEHWGNKFWDMGCQVDVVEIGRFEPSSPHDDGTQPADLSDVAGRMPKVELAKALLS